MPTLSFDGETHDEITQKVRRWLASIDGAVEDTPLSPAEFVNQSAELTKEALRVIAQAAPAPVAQSDLVKSLTTLGYKATDATRSALLDGLDAMETATGGSVVRKVTETGSKVAYEMNKALAKQLLKTLTGG
jgi:hypothetical protein